MRQNFFSLAVFLLSRASLAAPPLLIGGSGPVVINLAEEKAVPLQLVADGSAAADVSVDSGELSAELKSGSIALDVLPKHVTFRPGEPASVTLRVLTRTDAASFEGKHFGLVAALQDGAAVRAELSLTVKAVYVVKVINGDPFNFDSPAEELSFRAHPEGLQFLFQNFSARSCVIHGDGGIAHQDLERPLPPVLRGPGGEAVLDPNGTYAPRLILPADGTNLEASYTIHGVYHPERKVRLNVPE
ncbi:MAG: hypothetical protein ACXVB9_02285 [Bdellovibrionota bacterium]